MSDVIAARVEAGSLTLVRQFFQGKLNGDMRVERRRSGIRFLTGRCVARGCFRKRLGGGGSVCTGPQGGQRSGKGRKLRSAKPHARWT